MWSSLAHRLATEAFVAHKWKIGFPRLMPYLSLKELRFFFVGSETLQYRAISFGMTKNNNGIDEND